MQLSRFTSFFVVAAFGVMTYASPLSLDVVKSQETVIVPTLNTLKVTTDVILPQISDLAKAGNATLESLTPLVDQLTAALDTATGTLGVVPHLPLVTRQIEDDVANLVAGIVTDISTTLDAVIAVPGVAGLLVGVDMSLNQVLLGLEILLAGVLNLVANLLVNVAGLLRSLSLGLILGTLGL